MPLPIGRGQTISQPTVVAMMTEALRLVGRERILEIGTGSGYQAAVLSLLGCDVTSVEVVSELAESARVLLERLGFRNVHVHDGDGYAGWPEGAPYDRVIVTAASPTVPITLVDELADSGLLVMPLGWAGRTQRLIAARKTSAGLELEDLGAVSFVPMVHEET
jgi:protein-L-isoaspartate(D-aspartate) O-methyltransferase